MQNKKYLLAVLLFISVILISGVLFIDTAYAQVSLGPCNDSDGDNGILITGLDDIFNLNITEQGSCVDYLDNYKTEYIDECTSSTTLAENYCTSDGVCATGTLRCPNGASCVDGACVTTNTGSTNVLVPDSGSTNGLMPDCGSAGNPCGFDDFFVLLHNITEFLIFALAPILVVLMISVGGFTIMASRGNPAQFTTGKNMITWALIGYIVILSAWVIVNTILTSIGVASWVGIGDWWDPTF